MNMISWILLTIIVLGPAPCVWRFNKRGIVVGALIGWLAGLLPYGVTNPDPQAVGLRFYWLRYGWVVTLCYATFWFIVKWIYLKVRQPRTTPPL